MTICIWQLLIPTLCYHVVRGWNTSEYLKNTSNFFTQHASQWNSFKLHPYSNFCTTKIYTVHWLKRNLHIKPSNARFNLHVHWSNTALNEMMQCRPHTRLWFFYPETTLLYTTVIIYRICEMQCEVMTADVDYCQGQINTICSNVHAVIYCHLSLHTSYIETLQQSNIESGTIIL